MPDQTIKYIRNSKNKKYLKITFQTDGKQSFSFVDNESEATPIKPRWNGWLADWLLLLTFKIIFKTRYLEYKRIVYMETVSASKIFKTLADMDNMKIGGMK